MKQNCLTRKRFNFIKFEFNSFQSEMISSRIQINIIKDARVSIRKKKKKNCIFRNNEQFIECFKKKCLK